jgi:hypothetical protein
MDHWFDSLTKGMASYRPSRGTALASFATALAAAGTSWDAARAATPRRPTPQPPATKTATFGPCTLYSKGGHYEHHLVSKASASGHNAELRRTRTVDPKTGTTHDTTILVDGKPQIDVTATFTKSSETHKFVFGNGIVPGGAMLTSSDGGKTFRGTIGGKAIVPYTIGSGRLRFANGAPPKRAQASGVIDAVKAVAKQADADLEQCTANAHAFVPNGTYLAQTAGYSAAITSKCGGYPDEMLSLATGNRNAPNMTCGEYYLLLGIANHNGKPQIQATTNTWFTPLCEACYNKCGGNLFDEIVNVVGCVIEAYESYCTDGCRSCFKAVNYSSKQFNCQQGCQNGKACNPVPCGGSSNYGNLSCLRDEICVASGYTGICCPKTHTKACGSAGVNVYGWMNFSNQPGPGQPWIGAYCCDEEAPCLYDTRFGSQSSSYYDNGYYCCPKAQICGTLKDGVYVGVCCFPKQHCCNGSCCPPESVCATEARSYMAVRGNPNASTAGGAKVCCHPKAVRNGECCQSGHWCGDQCCGASVAFGCPKGKCPPQPTMCLTGVHCGFVCCNTGCANPDTSTCKSTSKCTGKFAECLTFPEMGATSVCCPKGVTCGGGKCCGKGTKACMHVTTGKIGCYPASQCAPPLPPPK